MLNLKKSMSFNKMFVIFKHYTTRNLIQSIGIHTQSIAGYLNCYPGNAEFPIWYIIKSSINCDYETIYNYLSLQYCSTFTQRTGRVKSFSYTTVVWYSFNYTRIKDTAQSNVVESNPVPSEVECHLS